MLEFGAKLSLKDNMYATLQKNLRAQREFTEQVNRTSSSIRGLGQQTANPTIGVNDRASGMIENVRDAVEQIDRTTATPELSIDDLATQKADQIEENLKRIAKMAVAPVVRLKDNITSEAGKIKQKLKDIATTYTPIVRIRDMATQGIAKIKNTLGGLASKIVSPIISVKDKASSVIKKVRVNALALGKVTAKPFIALKDKASPIVEKLKGGLKAIGKTVSKAGVLIKDGASKVLDGIKASLKGIGSTVAKAGVAIKDGATAGLSKIKDLLGSLAKGVTIAIGLAGAGATALLGGSIKEGASLEQSIGGVETLYKGDTSMVTANADMAYKTAGLSANEYMETVTSFSASLLQGLAGDTTKSAQIADMAIIDMADNANKFGTDTSSIQTAYQGFAKQNYTMLDNLKLGYGGTKEEMQRLLSDAQKLTGVKYDMNNLADVYSAIHAIQENLGVTGTTAKEAGSTFTGSLNAMKSSAKNLLGNLALGGDITASMEALLDSASTFLFDNAIPMIGRIFESLPDVISIAIEKGAPKIKKLGGTIVNALKEGLKKMLPSSMAGMVDPIFDGIGKSITGMISTVKTIFSTFAPVVAQLGDMFMRVAPVIQGALADAFGDNGGGLIQGFADLVSGAIPVVEQIILSVVEAFKAIIPTIQPILTQLSTIIQTIFPVITSVIAVFGNIVATVFPVIMNVISMVLGAVMPIVQAFAGLIQSALPIVEGIIQTFSNVVATIFPVVQEIFQGLGDKIAQIVGVVTEHMGLIQGIFETVSPILQSAIEIVATVLSTAWDIISPIIDLAIQIFDALLTCVEAVFPAVQAVIEGVWSVLEGIFGAIADGLSLVGDAISGVAEFVGNGIDTIGSWFGFAYGKDRVPYDNYPAVLHAGEKVLTRNQADQYERQMSTRGVQLTDVKPLERDENTGDTGNGTGGTGTGEDTKDTTKAGSTINIEKLADTVVIEKEADVDKVVEDMVKKFRKLVPNMA